MSTLRDVLTIARNELRVEMRSKEIVMTTTLFSLLMAVISSLAFYLDRVSALGIAPGVLWLALVFSGVLAMSRSWLREKEWQVIDALLLSPISRSALYAGKSLAVCAMMAWNALVLAFFVSVLCHMSQFFAVNPARNIGFLSLFLATGIVGFVATGMLFASMSVRARARELTLSIILFPLCAPALLSGVIATRELFAGAPDLELWNWLRILLAFDLVVIAACPVLFDRLHSNPS
jgi:heme exporter protein B